MIKHRILVQSLWSNLSDVYTTVGNEAEPSSFRFPSKLLRKEKRTPGASAGAESMVGFWVEKFPWRKG